MGLFFKKKKASESNTREQTLSENAGVPFITEIYNDLESQHLAYIYKNVGCEIIGDTSGLQEGAVLYIKEDGYLKNCNSEIVSVINDSSIVDEINDFYEKGKYSTVRVKYVTSNEKVLICNIGFYYDRKAKSGEKVIIIDKDPKKNDEFIESLNSIQVVKPEINVDCHLERQSLSSMPEMKIGSITKSFVIDAKLPSFIVLDVETTGLNVSKDRIIQLSAMRFEGREPIEVYDTYINPEMPIPEEATNVNGITNDLVNNSPNLSEVASSFVDFIGKSPIVGYNVSYDLSILYCSGIDLISKRKVYDGMVLAKKVYRKTLTKFTLEKVAEASGITTNCLHNSKADCLITGKSFISMIEELTE